ncbi:MAG: hypothetical protein QXL14_03575 [Candidatus Aenigmatarchaeota archaeon]
MRVIRQSVDDQYIFEISLWNFQPTLLCFQEDLDGNRKYFDLKFTDPNQEDLVYNMMTDSIEQAGGALNISGIYPISRSLRRFLTKEIREGKIEVVAVKDEK